MGRLRLISFALIALLSLDSSPLLWVISLGMKLLPMLCHPRARHYFHYFLTDETGHQIDSVGVKLHEPPAPDHDDSALSSSSPSMEQRTILHLHRTTLHLFKSFQGENMTENETLIHLIDQAQLVSQLQQQLHQAQQQIQQLQSQLASTSTPETPTPEIPPSSTTVTTDETPQPLPDNDTHPMDAVMLLVNSMSQLTHKMDLLLDRTISTDAPQTTTAPRSSKPKPIGSIRALKEKQNIADLHRVIDLLIQHNNSTEPERDRWFISKNILKQVVATQPLVNSIYEQRKSDIDAHHQALKLTPYHNRSYHKDHLISDFIDWKENDHD